MLILPLQPTHYYPSAFSHPHTLPFSYTRYTFARMFLFGKHGTVKAVAKQLFQNQVRPKKMLVSGCYESMAPFCPFLPNPTVIPSDGDDRLTRLLPVKVTQQLRYNVHHVRAAHERTTMAKRDAPAAASASQRLREVISEVSGLDGCGGARRSQSLGSKLTVAS
jgi:hypothetical protein